MDRLTFTHKERELSVRVRSSARARTMSAAVHPGGEAVLTVPAGCSLRSVERFVARHADWILWTSARMARLPRRLPLKGPRAEYERHKEAARRRAYVLIERFAPALGVSPTSVSVRNGASRWGSCSGKGTICFHYRLAELPDHLAEYLVVHELCHLRHMDHSCAFWAAVASVLPRYRALKDELHALRG